jgi:murein endopeptidase
MRAAVVSLAVALVAAASAGAALARTPAPDGYAGYRPPPPADDGQGAPLTPRPEIRWRASRAIGQPWAGRLVDGVRLPAEGPDWFTWDPAEGRRPNRAWRRWGTDGLLRTVLRVLREYREANPGVARVGVGDLSRPRGGPFGREFGGLGHMSHQNGRDVDVWYPRVDGLERRPLRVAQVDRAAAQELVDRFVAAGAEKVFVGPRVGLDGPRRVVIALAHHDDHLHIRIPLPPE